MPLSRVGFGDFLMSMVDRLSKEPVTLDDVIDCLQQVNEAFSRELNPAVEYEAYAALRLCQAILRVHEGS